MNKLFKPLDVEDIEFRIQSISEKGSAIILVYKNARVDMNMLDKMYGHGFWQRKHEIINGVLFCSVGIYNKELKEWVWVQDCGTESATEKEKGKASDSFKRACFNLGIGRELYDYPLIRVKLYGNEFTVQNKRGKATWDLKLKEWKWSKKHDDNGDIVFLQAIDEKGNIRFNFGKHNPGKPDFELSHLSNLEQFAKEGRDRKSLKSWLGANFSVESLKKHGDDINKCLTDNCKS